MSRGREAETPTEVPGTGWMDVLWRVKDELGADRVSLIAAGIAFYGLLALFPAITAIVAIAGLLTEPAFLVEQTDQLADALPQEAAAIIIDQMKAVAGSHEGGLGLAAVAGILIALYSSSKGVANIIEGLNVAYDEEEKRGFLKLQMVTMALTLAVLFGFLLVMALLALLPALAELLSAAPALETLIVWIRWPVLFGLGVGGIMMLYRWGPSRDPAEWKWLTPGAVLACALWVVATGAFAFYVRQFGSYNETFGTLAGVVILLMWLWLSAYVLLLGAEFDAELEAQTKRDTTKGPDRPMGARGAVKADELGPARN